MKFPLATKQRKEEDKVDLWPQRSTRLGCVFLCPQDVLFDFRHFEVMQVFLLDFKFQTKKPVHL